MHVSDGKRKIARLGWAAPTAAALALAGCASSGGSGALSNGDPVFGLIGPDTPDSLEAVAEAPYAPPDPPTCVAIERELAELDRLLGPDVDQAEDDENMVEEWAKGAVRGLVPYRGVLRFLTGAGRKEKEKARAMMAGAVRRGYLKGIQQTVPCPGAATVAAAADAGADAGARAFQPEIAAEPPPPLP